MTARDSLWPDAVDRTTSVGKHSNNDATKHGVDCDPVCCSFWAIRECSSLFLALRAQPLGRSHLLSAFEAGLPLPSSQISSAIDRFIDSAIMLSVM